MAGVVREIWRYPAKSMLGDRVERAELLGHGMVGDRMWAVRDGVRGGIRGAKKISGLMRLNLLYMLAWAPAIFSTMSSSFLERTS